MHAVMRQILTVAFLLLLSGCFSGVTHENPDVVIWGFDGFKTAMFSVFLGTMSGCAGSVLGERVDRAVWRRFPHNRQQPSIVATCVLAAAGVVCSVYLCSLLARQEVKFGPRSFAQEHWFSPDVEVEYADITRVRFVELKTMGHSAGEYVRVELQNPLVPNGDPWVDLDVQNLERYKDALLAQFRERIDPTKVETP